MKTIAFFNTKGGVGKTTLIYHLAWMFADLGMRIVAADLDPQANLTARSLPVEALAEVEDGRLASIFNVVGPAISGDTPIAPQVYEVTPGFGLLLGHLELAFAEEELATAWAACRSSSQLVRHRAMRSTAVLAKAVRDAAVGYRADLALIDVGPNLGALNRAALLAADDIVVPLAPDIFSLQGLVNAGRALKDWRAGWASRAADTEAPPEGWPIGTMQPLGYVISRFAIYNGDEAEYFRRWINRVPEVFHRRVLGEATPSPAIVKEDDACLAWLKDYQVLMAMAHEARKPMFRLKPADGAIGGHQQAVLTAYTDFEVLARAVAGRAGIAL